MRNYNFFKNKCYFCNKLFNNTGYDREKHISKGKL